MTAAGGASHATARTCAHCGQSVATTFCVECGADVAGASFPLVHTSSIVAELMRRVSLGGGGAPGLWAFAHGAPVLGTMYWLFWLPLPPVSLGIAVYLFFNGNRIALQRRRYRDPAQFREVERAWAVAGGLLLGPTLLATLLWSIATLALLARAGLVR
jgi:threonine/homoserine efflux transporter RhtA